MTRTPSKFNQKNALKRALVSLYEQIVAEYFDIKKIEIQQQYICNRFSKTLVFHSPINPPSPWNKPKAKLGPME